MQAGKRGNDSVKGILEYQEYVYSKMSDSEPLLNYLSWSSFLCMDKYFL